MKKLLFSVFTLSLCYGATAQSNRAVIPAHYRNMSVVRQAPKTGAEVLQQPAQGHSNPNIVVTNNRTGLITAEEIGNTQYDLQTNGAPGDRIVNYGGGVVSAAWTVSPGGASGWPDRGTGYNHRDGSAWGAIPTARIEAARTGWPSLVGNGVGEGIFAHNSTTALQGSKRVGYTGAWTAATLPTQTGLSLLWCRSAMSGMNVHVIAAIDPSGAALNGVNGQMLYFRSTDGGTTWDKTDVVLPGWTSSEVVISSTDAYAINASGNNVAIAIFSEVNGVYLWKSTDNGDNFTKTSVAPFPIPLFDYRVLGVTTDVDGDLVIDTPTTVDGSGDLVLDANGKAHLTWGLVRILDDGSSDSYSYFPFTDGVCYWNEDHTMNDIDTIAFLQDRNGDNFFSMFASALPSTQVGATSHCNIATDAAGRVYVAYSALVDSTRDADDEPYRHVFVTGSEDGGLTWNPTPADIITDGIFGAGAAEFLEATFPVLATNVDGKLHIIYQADGDAGTGVQQTTPVSQASSIYYSEVDYDVAVGIAQAQPYTDINRASFKMTPNPAVDYSTVDFALTLDSEVSINVMDVNGAVIRTQNLGNLNAGSNQAQLNVSDLAAGIYMVRINTANGSITGKIVVVKK